MARSKRSLQSIHKPVASKLCREIHKIRGATCSNVTSFRTSLPEPDTWSGASEMPQWLQEATSDVPSSDSAPTSFEKWTWEEPMEAPEQARAVADFPNDWRASPPKVFHDPWPVCPDELESKNAFQFQPHPLSDPETASFYEPEQEQAYGWDRPESRSDIQVFQDSPSKSIFSEPSFNELVRCMEQFSGCSSCHSCRKRKKTSKSSCIADLCCEAICGRRRCMDSPWKK
jgi:hypothetical protein